MVSEGAQFPDFNIKDHDGNEYSYNKLKGKKFVIFAYPKADTPGCTKEACSVRDYFKDIQKKGVEVFGLSIDPPEKNAKFASKYDLSYPLLSDPDKNLIEKLGIWGEKKFRGKTYMGVNRMSFIVDENGKVVKVFEKVKTDTHGQELLDEINNLGW
jgi:thioredoxin-dependent peroxiredoxin